MSKPFPPYIYIANTWTYMDDAVWICSEKLLRLQKQSILYYRKHQFRNWVNFKAIDSGRQGELQQLPPGILDLAFSIVQ